MIERRPFTSGDLALDNREKTLAFFMGLNIQLDELYGAVNGSWPRPLMPPATASSPGIMGTFTWDANYLYICTAANTWKRAPISSL